MTAQHTLRLLSSLVLACTLGAFQAARAQDAATLSGRVVHAETNEPLAGAHVFLAYTALGAPTDADGRYQIRNIPPGSYEVVASMVGFQTQIQQVEVEPDARPGALDFRLPPVVYEMDDLEVAERRPRAWRRNLSRFEELFLGASDNARQTRILNPHVLDFETDRLTGAFRASARQPLHIENRALGYRVTFVLQVFHLDPHRQILHYSGQPYFEPLEPEDEEDLLRWQEHRAQTYAGSLTHLLRAMAHDRVTEEGFLLLKDYMKEEEGSEFFSSKLIDLKPVRLEEILWQTSRPDQHEIAFSDHIRVIYRRERKPHRYRRDRSPEEQISWLSMNTSFAIIYDDGYLFPPNALTVLGYLGTKRMADLLPREYGLMLQGDLDVDPEEHAAPSQGETMGLNQTSEGAALYSVAAYDPERDPSEDLEATVRQARATGRRILLEVGGAWCSWCHALDRYIRENEAVAEALRRHFIIMKVNYSPENRNEAFLSNYPPIPGYPHLYVLERDGTLLHTQGTAALEEGASYNQEVFLAFLNEWTPEP